MGRKAKKRGGPWKVLLILVAILAAGMGGAIYAVTCDVDPDVVCPPEPGGPDEAGGAAAGEDPGANGAGADAKRKTKSMAGPVVTGIATLQGELRYYKGKAPAPGIELTLKRPEGVAITVTTAADGAFAFSKIAAGVGYELRGGKAGFAPIEVTGIDLAPDQTSDLGVLWLAVPVDVNVEVVDDRGAPIAEADVSAFTMGRPRDDTGWWWDEEREQRVLSLVSTPRPNKTAKTAADGKVKVTGLMPGLYRIVADAGGRATESKSGILLMPDAAPTTVRLVLGPGHALTGKVTDDKNQPVAGVRIIAVAGNEWMPGQDKWTGDTGPDGVYTVQSLPAGQMTLYLQRPGMPLLQVGTAGIPDTTRFDIRLQPSGTIRGTVTSEDGKPVGGAVIVMAMQNTWTPISTKTKADGTYEMPDLPAGPLGFFRVDAEGFIPYPDPSANQQGAGESLRTGAVMVRDVVLRKGLTASFQVMGDDGTVLEGATVTLLLQRMWGGDTRPWRGTTDKAGACQVTGLLAGEYLAIVRADGWVQPGMPPWWQNLLNGGSGGADALPPAWRVSLRPDVETKREFKLTRGGIVRGKVLDARGEPAAGAKINVNGARTEYPVFSDAEGKFEVTAVPPVLRANAYASIPEKGAGSSEPFAVKAGTPTENIEIKLALGGKVTGTVRTRDGSALTGVIVRWRRGEYDPEEYWYDTFEGAERFPVGPDGRFTLTNVASGNVTVRADAEGCLPGINGKVVVTADQETGGIDLLLGVPREIKGRVEPQTGGAPVAGAIVYSQFRGTAEQERWGFATGLSGQPMAQTDENGAFVLRGLEDGNYDVWAQADGYAAGAMVKTQTGAGEIVVQLATGKTIGGVVKNEDGKGLGGIPVNAIRVDPAGGQRNWYYWSGGGYVYTAPDGTFEIKDLADTGYNLQVSGAWQWSREVNIEDTTVYGVPAGKTDVEITLRVGGVIEGKLLDREDKPVRVGWIYAQFEAGTGQQDWSSMRYGQVRPDGSFRLAGLKSGQWTITAWGSFRSEPRKGVSIGTKDVEIRVEPGYAITGQVLDEKGLSVPHGVQIQIRKAGTQNWERRNVLQPGDGRFIVANLTEGAWDLLVQVHESAPLQVLNIAAGTQDLIVSMKKGLEITGYVTDGAGAPIAGANVQAIQLAVAEGSPPSQAYAETDAQGRFKLGGLAEGRYRLIVQAENLARAIRTGVEAGALDQKFILTAGTTISGTLVNAAGEGIVGAVLNLMLDDFQMARAATVADGKFEFQAVPEGMTFRISGRFRPSGGTAWSPITHDAAVESGAKDLKIEVK